MDSNNLGLEKVLAETRFSSEDLFALMGGFDAAWFACRPGMTGPDDPALARKLDKWRRRAAARYGRIGLVDAAANPCPQLAAALEAMREPAVTVEDGQPDEDPSRPDGRTACVCIGRDGSAAVVSKGRGPFGGFFISRPSGERGLLDAVLGLHGVKGNVGFPGVPAGSTLIADDPSHRWINAALEGRPSEVIAMAEERGIDPEGILALGRWWEDEGRAARGIDGAVRASRVRAVADDPIAGAAFDAAAGRIPTCVDYSTGDFTGGEVVVEGGISTGVLSSSISRRFSRLFVPFGFLFSIERSPLPGDPPRWWDEFGRSRNFDAYDFLSSEDDLARRLLTVDENPGGRAA